MSSFLFDVVFSVVIQRSIENREVFLTWCTYTSRLPRERPKGAEKSEGPLARVKLTVWRILSADNAGIVSLSSERLTKMIAVVVEVWKKLCPTVSKIKTGTMSMPARNAQLKRVGVEASG